MKKDIEFLKQSSNYDCGQTCFRMICLYYEINLENTEIDTNGRISFYDISQLANKVGLRTIGVRVNINELKELTHLPCILHWGQNHFIVLCKIAKDLFYIADPAIGIIELNQIEFSKNWLKFGNKGDVLIIHPPEIL